MDISHHTTDSVVVEDQTATTGFFEDVKYLFSVAETIEERCRSTQVLSQTREEQNMRVDTLQFVHDSTDHLHTIAHLYSHGFFDTHTQCMAVLHCAQVVQTVCQCQGLWISHLFVQLFYTAVDITQYWINLTNSFAFQFHAEVQYTVS